MPTFCRHNRLVQNCPICAREQEVEARPLITPGGQTTRSTGGASARTPGQTAPARRGRAAAGRAGAPGVTVRRLARGADDGYRCGLVPGLRSGEDAARLAEELAFAHARLACLHTDPPGLYADLARAGDLEERTWLAFLIAYLGPLDAEDPFAAIRAAHTSWASGEPPRLDGATAGPRGALPSDAGGRTVAGYRAWVQRAGSQEAAFTGEASWTPERRFARLYERLALPGFPRAARFELLGALGHTGVYDLRAGTLALGGGDHVTLAAKRLLGIGDPMLLQRRAADLAAACGLELEVLDVGFENWERGQRARLGMGPELEPDPEALAAARAALEL